MYIVYEDYIRLNYSLVPELEFPRYEAMARKKVDKYTFGRVTAENITEDNKYGMCEIIDVYYLDKNPQIDNENKVVSSFSNEGYSETYVTRKQASADVIKTTEDIIYGIVNEYFTDEQLHRGIDNVRL